MNHDGVTNGKTTLNKDGITIQNADTNKNIVINDGNISFGGNQVKNMGSGSDGKDSQGNVAYNINTNGANIGDAKNISDARRTIVESSDGSVTVTDKNANNPNAVNHDYDLHVDYNKAASNLNLNYTGDNNTSGSNPLSGSVAFNGTTNQIVTKAQNGKVAFGLTDEVDIGKTASGNDGKVNVIDKNGDTGVSIWANSGDQTKGTSGGHISLTGAKPTDNAQGAFVDIWTEYGH